MLLELYVTGNVDFDADNVDGVQRLMDIRCWGATL